MSILTYIESKNNKPKKSSFEIISYAKQLSKHLSIDLIVVAVNIDDTSTLNKYGPDKVVNINDQSLEKFDAKIYADIISGMTHMGNYSFKGNVATQFLPQNNK